MSFKNFSHLNEFIATTANVADKLNSIISACQQGLTQLSSIKQISDAYARQYSLVQQIQYDADGNIQDVTSADRLSVPNTVIDNAKDAINKCSLAIKRISPVDLGSTVAQLTIHPVAKMYTYSGLNSNELVNPVDVKTIEDYYYVSGNSLFISNEFANELTSISSNVGFHMYMANNKEVFNPVIMKLPYSMNGVPGNHQIALIGDPSHGIIYVRHTGDFAKYSKLQDIVGKDLFSEGSYSINYADIGGHFQWAHVSNDKQAFNLPNAVYNIPGDILGFKWSPSSNTYTANSIDCYYRITSDATDNMWAILTALADNGASIMNILNQL